jgi:hypothetical protein
MMSEQTLGYEQRFKRELRQAYALTLEELPTIFLDLQTKPKHNHISQSNLINPWTGEHWLKVEWCAECISKMDWKPIIEASNALILRLWQEGYYKNQ